MTEATGRITQILGGVVDVDFSGSDLPEVYFAVEVIREGEKPLVLEVQNHLGNGWVRTVAMDSTDGLVRGMPVVNTGAPIKVPVGEASLGRVFNVLGEPVDGGPELAAPMSFGSLHSKLIALLDSGHYDVQLTRQERQRLTTWIDLNCPLWPDYDMPLPPAE